VRGEEESECKRDNIGKRSNHPKQSKHNGQQQQKKEEEATKSAKNKQTNKTNQQRKNKTHTNDIFYIFLFHSNPITPLVRSSGQQQPEKETQDSVGNTASFQPLRECIEGH
jgi:hypothetical protein